MDSYAYAQKKMRRDKEQKEGGIDMVIRKIQNAKKSLT